MHTHLAKVMRELLFILNDMSKPSLESKIHSKVGQTARYLPRINKDRWKEAAKRLLGHF